ncbi:AraC family transcriptional regulator of adaptative response / DNA-3-methyladenine glycosylase II [Actimicrobium sp. GrIS 1.19]|uniref:AlkA N-terminal domain-containing protein n=1 Tax=Actimicrobium sp. GrIS 1.19 TaxID=3071708 RepID=UPI002DF89AE4|nr:AraC family transcriptional regulator of adaptative response / DNA-3-methyladenine glycosylase II [Actimicrobium sp. GrIS 1.19]
MDTLTPAPHGATSAHDSFYRALAARDTRFDGVFFTGVKTTGIYCRPVCPARTPHAASCTFFSSAAAAEQAGFRPCLRCRPELAPYALQQNLAYAVWQRIAAGALNHQEDDSGIERLAETVGLSSRQLRRVLLQHFGVTPVELAQTQRLLFAKKLLQETTLPMTDVAYASGFGSVRRFNALFASRYAMAPTAIRRAVARIDRTGGDALTLRLAYRPPYAWQAVLAYLRGRAIPGLEAIDDAGYLRSVRLGEVCGWLRVTHLPLRHQIQLEVAPSLAGVLMPLLARVRTQFDLDANPTQIEGHLQHDPLLATQIARLPGLRVPGAFDPFELALRAVLGQQVSVAGATTLSGRLVTQFGEPAETPFATVSCHFPRAERLAVATVESIAAIGVPRSRAETIQAVARFAAAGGLQMRPGLSLDDTVSALRSVRGIGEWTAQYIALRALRYPDAFPAGDLGLQKAAADGSAGQTRLTEKELLARGAHWSPWRGYASLLLWHSLAA